MLNIDEQVKPEHHFWLKNGKPIASMKELADEFEHMDSKTFSHHINEERNDFHNWVRDVFHEQKLADRLLSVESPSDAKDVILERLNEINEEKEKEWKPAVTVPEDFFKVKQTDKPKIELLPYNLPEKPQSNVKKKIIKKVVILSDGKPIEKTVEKRSIVRKYVAEKAKKLDNDDIAKIKREIQTRNYRPDFSMKDFALGFVIGVLVMAIIKSVLQ